MKLLLLLALALPIAAQQADFSKSLNSAIKSLKMKQPPAGDLPDAVSCDRMALEYKCEWKSRATKASVTALEESISSQVAAALPAWKRDSYVRDGLRYVRFTDPAGQLAIRISGKASDDGVPPWDYTVYLLVGDAKLVGYGNSQR